MIAECLSRAGDDSAQLGAALALLCTLACPPAKGLLQRPTDAFCLLEAAAEGSRLLLDSAAEHQDAEMADKGLLLAAAAARSCSSSDHGRLPEWHSGAGKLQRLLMRTMLAMPLQPLRHRAFYALEALLAAFQADIRLQAVEEMISTSLPSVAALLLHSLTRWVTQSWPQSGNSGSDDWKVLRHRLLPVLEATILTNGSCGWSTPPALIEQAEPLCAAVNLLRLLLTREKHQGPILSDATIPAALSHNAVCTLSATAEAVLASLDQQGPEDLAAALGLERILEVTSIILET
ncbi:hypothetical protein WJX84_005912 [Apatococcus fuscideae]|uniref:Neurochondrin-like protein n=1 Tax=Apatococcus fuscideae TaxID=2026836 RepID=A0AAW1TBJ6_9CHLO